MKHEVAEWVRKLFKGNKVWMATDHNGHPLTLNNKVLIKYQLDQEYEYWVKKNHVFDISSADSLKHTRHELPGKNRSASQNNTRPPDQKKDREKEIVTIYTDGASSGNPGPSGIGILMEYGGHKREISKFIGTATNNIAELTAVYTALLELKRRDVPIRLYTDSNYAFGLLTAGWKAKKNIELINSIKQMMSQFYDLEILKVKGHAGIGGNERADQLATEAINSKK